MVRVNLIAPKYLADQHLVAEYDEILMLLGYVRKYPAIKDIPEKYTLGKGHIKFFKDKLLYLKKRHDRLIEEMLKRKFAANKKIDLSPFQEGSANDWKPDERAVSVIKKRIIEKLGLKKDYYRYYGEKRPQQFFIRLVRGAKV